MLQVNIHGPNDVRLDPAREAVAGANDIILRTGACGICGSDIAYIDAGGMPAGPNPSVMALGHEFAGTVEKVGHAVQGIVPGQKVVVDPMAADNIGNGGPEGAFTPRLLVRNARLGVNVHAVPADMPFERAALQSLAGPEAIQAAVTVVAMVPLVAIYPFLQRYFTRGIMIGSVKG